jgi:hypothetical protein
MKERAGSHFPLKPRPLVAHPGGKQTRTIQCKTNQSKPSETDETRRRVLPTMFLPPRVSDSDADLLTALTVCARNVAVGAGLLHVREPTL